MSNHESNELENSSEDYKTLNKILIGSPKKLNSPLNIENEGRIDKSDLNDANKKINSSLPNDEMNFATLNTEESMNVNQQFYEIKLQNTELPYIKIKDKPQKISKINPENNKENKENINNTNFSVNKPQDINQKQTIINKEKKILTIDLPETVTYTHQEDISEGSLSSDIENIEFNKQYSAIRNLTPNTILALKNRESSNIPLVPQSKNKDYPYHIEDENLHFNKFDFYDHQCRNSYKTMKEIIDNEVVELKRYNSESFYHIQKEHMKNTSFLDNQIKKEFNNRIKKENRRVLEDYSRVSIL